MTEHPRPWPVEEPAKPSRASDSQLRLVTADGAVVFPQDAQPTDDQPTIISKNKPGGAETPKPAQAHDVLGGSLRGRKLAHFELIEPIGVGGMAAVLRARDTQLDRFVALKILPPDMAQDEENIRRFHQEARAAAKLDHENIARVFFCGEDQRLHFIAFEFVEGDNLKAIMEKRGRLPVGEAVRYLIQVGAGLEHAAARGVVHRDVKPSNIIITPAGRAKLVDMGLARSQEKHSHDLTQSGVTLGTFDYISPEQALEPRDADARSDIYSLGCTFYHLLTGQAPVPDGTAAKKLHHHQHVAPVDPRQLNPDIPDELAAILARMMAKEPRDRYQRPIHLVQHLMQIAEKVGATADLPEGGMVIDAPLPQAPQKRPLLVVSLAALALAGVLLLLSFAPGPRAPQFPVRPVLPGPDKSIAKDAPPPGKGGPSVAPVTPLLLARSEPELAQMLGDARPNLHIYVEGDIDLGEGLAFRGDQRHLTLESRDPYEPATLRFKYQARTDATDHVAGLFLDGGTITISNIRFEIEAGATPEIAVAALGIRGQGTVKLERCVFVQKGVPQRAFILSRTRIPIASVMVDNPGGSKDKKPRVLLDRCYFYGAGPSGPFGQVAIGVNGPADVFPTDCAFKPHGALFHLRGDSKDFASTVKLQRCSAFVVGGPAFRIDDDAFCNLTLEQCLFSCTDNLNLPTRDEPHLIRQTRAAVPAVRFEGLRNCYHNLNALWVWPSDGGGNEIVADLEKFRPLTRGDVGSVVLAGSVSPWASSQPLKEEFPQQAFQLRSDLPEVRTTDGKRPLGLEQCAWGQMAPLGPLPVQEAPVVEMKLRPHEKVVDPEESGGAPNVFPNLFQALALAKPGDVILIKQPKTGRLLDVRPYRFDQGGVDLTIKPYPGHAPILTMAQTSEEDAAFFRLADGKLTFEHLEFVVEPDQENFSAMAVVLLSGGSACHFKNSVVTLKPSDRAKLSRRLSVVTLMDPEKSMKMAPTVMASRLSAEVHLIDSFVRGEGDLVQMRASRPLDLNVDNSLLALAGALLHATGAGKDQPADPPVQVRLNKSSAFLSEPLVVLRQVKTSKGLVPTKLTCKENLFVHLGDKALIHIEAGDVMEDTLRPLFDWKGERNAFCNLDRLLEVYRPDDPLALVRFDPTRWSDFTRDVEAKYPTTPFILPLSLTRTFWQAAPSVFVPDQTLKEDLAPFGAAFEPETLPRLLPVKGNGN